MIKDSHPECVIPKFFKDINSTGETRNWLNAVDEEFKSLEKNNTWTLVQRPHNRSVIGCRWVFNIRKDKEGPLRYKARLVGKGFNQQYPVDYDETFAPVARLPSFRLLMSIANHYNLSVHHIDVKTAFLNGILEEEIYMETPEGMEYNADLVCKLNRSLYGLKQSARCWFIELDKVLKQAGFVESKADRCSIYILVGSSIQDHVYLVLYVDDIVIITGKNSSQ